MSLINDALLEDTTRTAIFIMLYFVIFLLAKCIKDFLVRYKIHQELTQSNNTAVALTMSGYYLAVTAIFIGALLGPSHGIQQDFVSVTEYSLLGLIFLNVSRWVNDKVILRHFCNTEQLIQKQNISIGIAQFGAYLATGIIAAGAVSGQGGGLISSIVFFILGQLSLFFFSIVYEKISRTHIHQELLKQNVAASIAFSGHLIALSIIVLNGLSGNFVNWRHDIFSFFIANLLAFIFLPIIRLVMDTLTISGVSLHREINHKRNIGAGILTATIAVSFSVILFFLQM